MTNKIVQVRVHTKANDLIDTPHPSHTHTHTHIITPPAPSSHTLVRCNRMPRWPSQLANPTIQVRPVSPQGHGTVYWVLPLLLFHWQ